MVDLQVPVAGRSPVLIAASELRWRFSRSSGPGGQNVNTTDTRVELLQKALQPPTPPRRATKPSPGAVQRRLEAKKQRSAVKRQRRARVED